MNLRGAVVVVTGASSGIGEVTATAFARRGAKVVLAARRMDRLKAIASTIESKGGVAMPVACDVTERTALESLPAVVREAFGPCDVLVNNAGMRGGGDFLDVTYERLEKVIRVNLLGVVWATRAFLPGMVARRHGHIVNVASLAGRFATPGAAIYGATKHGVVAFSEGLFYEAEPFNVRVTSVNPGYVETEGFPQEGMDPRLLIPRERVAETIVRVVREGIAPELSIPRWVSPLQLFRVATPPLYRWGVRRARRQGPHMKRDP